MKKITLVILPLAAILLLIVLYVFLPITTPPRLAAKLECKNMLNKMHHINYSMSETEVVSMLGNDIWGNPYKVAKKERTSDDKDEHAFIVYVFSAGRNGVFDYDPPYSSGNLTYGTDDIVGYMDSLYYWCYLCKIGHSADNWRNWLMSVCDDLIAFHDYLW